MNLYKELIEHIEREPTKNLNDFFQKLLSKLLFLLNAEGGTIYIKKKQKNRTWLKPAEIQNERIIVSNNKFEIEVNHHSIAGYVAKTGKPLILEDVYKLPPAPGSPYTFNSGFDLANGYRTRSMLCYPLKDFQDNVIGVIQILNHKSEEPSQSTGFDSSILNELDPIGHIIGRAIERMDAFDKIKHKNQLLKKKNATLQVQKQELKQAQHQTEEAFMISIRLLAKAAGLHDEDTGNHILRVSEYSTLLAKEIGMPKSFCDEISYSAQLHDVGKMSINSAILKKKNSLTPEERIEMNLHTVYGYRILSQSGRLTMAAEIAYTHHERWDGTGYPRGLKADEIPISARIVQVADVYDALRSKRSYKPAFSHAKTVKAIIGEDPTLVQKGQFDPYIVQAFVKCQDKMNEIWQRLSD